jgi:hypothetical protein
VESAAMEERKYMQLMSMMLSMHNVTDAADATYAPTLFIMHGPHNAKR